MHLHLSAAKMAAILPSGRWFNRIHSLLRLHSVAKAALFSSDALDKTFSLIPQYTCSISHNTPLSRKMCTFLFWMVHCGIRAGALWGLCDWCIPPTNCVLRLGSNVSVYSEITKIHCNDVIMSAMASHITGVSMVYSKETSKLCVTGLLRGILQWPLNSPHKGPVMRKMFSFDLCVLNKINENKTLHLIRPGTFGEIGDHIRHIVIQVHVEEILHIPIFVHIWPCDTIDSRYIAIECNTILDNAKEKS